MLELENDALIGFLGSKNVENMWLYREIEKSVRSYDKIKILGR